MFIFTSKVALCSNIKILQMLAHLIVSTLRAHKSLHYLTCLRGLHLKPALPGLLAFAQHKLGHRGKDSIDVVFLHNLDRHLKTSYHTYHG